MDALLDPLRDLLGGGTLSLWVVIAGLLAVWIAVKAVGTLLRLAAFGIAIALFLSAAPWAGEDVETDAAACAASLVEQEASGWQTALTKRITVAEVSPDAACAGDEVGLARGTAVVKLRTFYDLPYQTWDVDGAAAEARFDLSNIPLPGES